jgi:hypothetical protein
MTPIQRLAAILSALVGGGVVVGVLTVDSAVVVTIDNPKCSTADDLCWLVLTPEVGQCAALRPELVDHAGPFDATQGAATGRFLAALVEQGHARLWTMPATMQPVGGCAVALHLTRSQADDLVAAVATVAGINARLSGTAVDVPVAVAGESGDRSETLVLVGP